MAYSQIEIDEYARRIGRSSSTLWRWVREGCNLRDPKSVHEWIARNTIRETNISKARKRRRDEAQKTYEGGSIKPQAVSVPRGNGELPAAGRKGAAGTLGRLEREEEESYRRLQIALQGGNPVEIDAAQTFWLRCSETLRRLDLAIEISRRSEIEQIPLAVAQDSILFTAEWFRIAFMQFLSSECSAILGIKDVGELKAYMVERFKGILDLTVKNSLKTRSPVSPWAVEAIKQAWNVSL